MFVVMRQNEKDFHRGICFVMKTYLKRNDTRESGLFFLDVVFTTMYQCIKGVYL